MENIWDSQLWIACFEPTASTNLIGNPHGQFTLRWRSPPVMKKRAFLNCDWSNQNSYFETWIEQSLQFAVTDHMEQQCPFRAMPTAGIKLNGDSLSTRIGHLLCTRDLGGCTVLNLYGSTWVHRRGIDLDLAVLCIHTIDIFRTKKHSRILTLNIYLKRNTYVYKGI
jgi:hypothetical protein